MRKIPFTSAVRYRTCGKVQKNEIFFSPYLTEEQCVSNWENNNIQPSIDMLVKVSRLFSVSTDDLLGLAHRRYLDISALTDTQAAHIHHIVNDILELQAAAK